MTALMNRLTLHHTGGSFAPGAKDRKAYHRIVSGDGEVVSGTYAIEANAPDRIRAGAYAAHTKNLNNGNIGLSLACMGDGEWNRPFSARLFPTPAQVDAAMREAARLITAYGIELGPRTVLTHAEVQPVLGVEQNGKWDYDYDPRKRSTTRDPVAIGNELRQEIRVILGNSYTHVPAPGTKRPTLRQGSTGTHVRDLQAALQKLLLYAGSVDGAFGPKTLTAVMQFQRRSKLLIDGVVGPMTWAALKL